MTWRKNINPNLKIYIEKLVNDSFLYKKQYQDAGNKGNAQLWIAAALLSKHLYNIELKLKYIEKALQDMNPRFKKNIIERKKEETEIKNIIKKIARGKPVKINAKKRKKGKSKSL